MKKRYVPDRGKNRGYGVTGLFCAALAALLLAGCGGAAAPKETAKPTSQKGTYTVGTDIAAEDITEFYFTRSGSAFPPTYQRYRLFAEEGRHCLFHEKREGSHWPLTEADATVTGTVELSDEAWNELFGFLRDGIVKKRSEDVSSGGDGPWLYLYWSGDKGKYQEFSFASPDAQDRFEARCASLAGS